MAITCSLLAVIFGYSTSKYFPVEVPLFSKLSMDNVLRKIVSVLFYGIALVTFIKDYGSATGTLVWLFTITLLLSVTILGLSYRPKLVYGFLGSVLFFLILEFFSYAG